MFIDEFADFPGLADFLLLDGLFNPRLASGLGRSDGVEETVISGHFGSHKSLGSEEENQKRGKYECGSLIHGGGNYTPVGERKLQLG